MTDLRREILYKGKQKVSGNWIEGVPIRHSDGEWQIHGGYSNAGWLVTVIPETICQYTGLTDKNGRRYEGDIFQASDGDYIQRYIIAWDEDSLEWSAQCIGYPDGTFPLSEFKVGEIDVIGNIFDNPELLEEPL